MTQGKFAIIKALSITWSPKLDRVLDVASKYQFFGLAGVESL